MPSTMSGSSSGCGSKARNLAPLPPDPVQRSQAVRASIEAATTLLPDGGGDRFAGGPIQHALTNQICEYNDDPAR